MPVTKKITKKAIAKKGPATEKTKKAMKDDQFICDVCGLVVSVDTECGCVDTCDILCCSKPMKRKEKTSRKK